MWHLVDWLKEWVDIGEYLHILEAMLLYWYQTISVKRYAFIVLEITILGL